MDRGTLIRTHVAGDLGFILHSRHQYHWHTGYEPPQTVAAPHIGAGSPTPSGRGTRRCRRSSTSASATTATARRRNSRPSRPAASSAAEYGPFRIPDPQQAVASVRPPTGMSAPGSANRYRGVQETARQKAPSPRHGSDYQRESLLRSLENADRLLNSPAAKAFDLSLEPKDSLRRLQHRPVRPGLPAGPPAGRGRGAVHRSHDRIHSVPGLGHARQRPHARRSI